MARETARNMARDMPENNGAATMDSRYSNAIRTSVPECESAATRRRMAESKMMYIKSSRSEELPRGHQAAAPGAEKFQGLPFAGNN
jgi:hypothetical protein